jgi:hypothetical protein
VSSRPAGVTFTTGSVDVADNPPSNPDRIRCLDHLPNEFVPQHPPKAQVAPHQLKIGVADAGQTDADERLTRKPDRVSKVGIVPEALIAN